MDVTINIPAGTYDLTLPLVSMNDITSGSLDFPAPNPGYWIRLIGTGTQPAVIDANQLDRLFDIGLDVKIQMENIVIKGGLLSRMGTADFHDGAGILNLGTLMLNRMVIEENEASYGQTTCAFNISYGYNTYSDNTCPATGAGDYGNTNPMLGHLGGWGGPTMTMPPLPGSPAVNHRTGCCVTIPENPVLPPSSLVGNQQHSARIDASCDSGAIEDDTNVNSVFLPMLFK